MKRKTLVAIAVAAFAGYIIARDKAHKELVKTLVKRDAFEKYNEENSDCQMDVHWNREGD